MSVTLKLLYTPFVIHCTLDLTHTHATTGMDLEAMHAISSLHRQQERLCVRPSERVKLYRFHATHSERKRARCCHSAVVFVLQLCFAST